MGAMRLMIPRRGARIFLHKTFLEFTEITKVVHGLNIQQRQRSYAASVPSEVPKAQKGRKRVSKDERHAMVESYVNKYRETHAGQFPTTSDAKKQVGGSYYVVKKIIQELVCKSKGTSNSRNGNLLEKKISNDSELLSKAKEVSSRRMIVEAEIQNDSQTVAFSDMEVCSASGNDVETVGGSQTSTWAETTLSKETGGHSVIVGRETNLLNQESKDISDSCFGKTKEAKAKANHSKSVARQSKLAKEETEEVSHPGFGKTEDGEQKEAQGNRSQFVATDSCPPKDKFKDLPHFDDPKHKAEQYQKSPELDEFARDISKDQTYHAELSRKTTLWGNLKAFADGIINAWRKM